MKCYHNEAIYRKKEERVYQTLKEAEVGLLLQQRDTKLPPILVKT